jgi:hypothetical protein
MPFRTSITRADFTPWHRSVGNIEPRTNQTERKHYWKYQEVLDETHYYFPLEQKTTFLTQVEKARPFKPPDQISHSYTTIPKTPPH